MTSFNEVCIDVTKTARKIPQSDYLVNGKYKIFDQGKDYIGGYTDDDTGIVEEYPYIVFGDHTRIIKFVNEPCFIGADGVKLLKVYNLQFLPKYVYYSLVANPIVSIGYSRHFKYLKEQSIRDCSIDEQKRIITELENHEKAISIKKESLSSLDELVKSRFIEMFGDIDLSPQKSEWTKLSDLGTIYTGTTPSTGDETNWDGSILWITPAEMNDESFFIDNTIRKITEKGMKSKCLSLMPVGTVLLSTRAPIGKVGIVAKPMTCNQGFKNFYCPNKLNSIFLYVVLKNNTQYLNAIGTGTTFKEISKTTCGNIRVPVPPIELQNEFAEFVKLIDKSKFIVQQQIKDLQELLDSKMDKYFR